jgi:pimeloyl-ACP methyl ester carboxylesterase
VQGRKPAQHLEDVGVAGESVEQAMTGVHGILRDMLQDFLGGEYLGRELDPPVKTRFAEITVPVSVLLGGRDFQGTALWARRLASQAPSATLTVIPDADHFPMLSTPQEFERILREVLQSRLARPGSAT